VEIAISELPVKNLTSPFASATPISCYSGVTLLPEYIFATFSRFL